MSDISKVKELNTNFKKVLEECPDLVFIGDPVLRQRTQEVSLEEGMHIASKLKEILGKYRATVGYGRGLAAPQIGVNKSVFVTYIDDQYQIYINPKIIKKSDVCNLYREGCISCGILSADVRRAKSVTLEYMNESGEIKIIETDSFLARLLQHEYDHLQGIVNIDIAEPHSIEFMIKDPLKEQLRDC